jgi:chloramphenicol-sensitive protein RarD
VKAQSDERRGLIFGFAAYLAWGVFPLYFPLLKPANAVEILAQRMIWTLVVMLVVVWRLRLWAQVGAVLRDRRQLRLLTIAALTVSVNWGVYIWAVNAGHVIEASLGYFINPLITIVLGVVVLRERLRPTQWTAVAIASVAIVVIAVDYGRLPWIALTLAMSFALYGLMKKKTTASPVESLTVETTVLALPAATALIVLAATDRLTFGHHGAGQAALLAGAGLVTAIPLLLFAGAARRLPLSTIGLIQYLTPVLQFLLGYLVDHEQMSASRWIGFGLVWLALAILTVDGLRQQRRNQQARAAAALEDQPVRSSTL